MSSATAFVSEDSLYLEDNGFGKSSIRARGVNPQGYAHTLSIVNFGDEFSFDTRIDKPDGLTERSIYTNVDKSYLVFLRDSLNKILGE